MSVEQHAIWRLRPEATAHIQRLPPEQRRDFRLYNTGVNLFFASYRIAPPPFDLIRARFSRPFHNYVTYMKDYALQYMNPFHEFLRDKDLADYDIHEETNRMGLYLLGRQLTDLDATIIMEQARRDLDEYENPHDLFYTMVGFAKEILNGLSPEELLPFRRPTVSNAGAHARSRGDREKSPPTWGDLKHISDNLERLNMRRNWVFEETISQNGHGRDEMHPKRRIVHLFAAITDEGILEKRIVVKVEGHYNIQAVEESQHEFNVHEDLTAIESPFILACYGSSLRERRLPPNTPSPPRLLYGYLEYAPFADLHDLANYARENDFFIPEFFLWRIFHGLTVALYNLDMGKTPPKLNKVTRRRSNDNLRNRHKKKTWRSIVNLDIKSANVVLAEPDEDYPAFPVPKMMDFGICFRNEVDTENRYVVDNMEALNGTNGWRPPEQLHLSGLHPHPPPYPSPLSTHTHIFSLGLILLHLMNRSQRPYFEFDVSPPTHRKDYDHMYSSRLEDLVKKCVALVPGERPTLGRLLWETQSGVNRARKRCVVDPWGRGRDEVEEGLRVRWVRSREVEIGADMGGVWRYAKRRRVEEEGGGGGGEGVECLRGGL